MATVCPSPEELALIGVGTNDGSCPSGMVRHIEGCPACRDFLEQRVRDGLGTAASGAATLPEPDAIPRIEGFTIERELGRGGMGVVYLARRAAPSRQVALKLLPGGRRASTRERRQWLREAEAAAAVRHPNVVALYEVGESDDWFLLVLEYIPGGTLAARLDAPLAPRIAARWVETIARAVHFIHGQGQLHLDLKPSNILLDDEAGGGWEGVTPKVSDFGIARPADSDATETGAPALGGTPSYMAPEQVTGVRQDMSARTDVHGLGSILYHVLTGRPPYQGATVLETIDLVRRQEPIPPRRLNPKIPADLETICLKCLEKPPGRRYASAALLADDLARWQAGHNVLARPASPAEKCWRWCRRRPLVAALASVLALTVVAGFVVVATLWRRAESARLRAETNLRMCNELITDLVDLTTGGEGNQPKLITPAILVPLLEKDRSRLLALCASQPVDGSLRRQLAVVENRLCESCLRSGRHADARAISLESLARVQLLAQQNPGDEAVRDLQYRRIRCLAEASDALRNSRDAVMYLKQAVVLNLDEMQHGASTLSVGRLLDNQRALGWLLVREGKPEEARVVFAANRRLLEDLPPALKALSSPVERLRTRIDFLVLADGSSGERSVLESGDSERRERLKSPTDPSQPPPEWARLVFQSLRRDDGDPASVRREATDAWLVADYLSAVGATFRRLNHVEAARRVAERIVALGNLVAEAHPSESASHLVLSIAYTQKYKNSIKENDAYAVQTNMKLALRAARRALDANPGSEHAQQAVCTLQQKLAALTSKE